MYNLYNLESKCSSIVSLSIEEIVEKFKLFLLKKRISRSSIRCYLSDIRHFLGWQDFFLKSNHLYDSLKESPSHSLSFLNYVNPSLLDTYKNYLVGNNTPQKTINRRFSSLRKFGAFSQEQGWLKVNLFDTLKNIPEEQKPFPESIYHLEEFKVYLWKNNLRKASLKNYLNDIKQFIEWQKLR